jgi:hypothetical protein
MAESFFESGICRSRAHCATCQGTGDAARGFRLSLSAVGITGLPGDGSPPQCPHGQKPQPLTIGGVVHGAVGLVKAAAGMDKAPDDVIAERARLCAECVHGEGRVLCGVCSCVLAAKQRLASERCPLDPPRWDAVATTGR